MLQVEIWYIFFNSQCLSWSLLLKGRLIYRNKLSLVEKKVLKGSIPYNWVLVKKDIYILEILKSRNKKLKRLFSVAQFISINLLSRTKVLSKLRIVIRFWEDSDNTLLKTMPCRKSKGGSRGKFWRKILSRFST